MLPCFRTNFPLVISSKSKILTYCCTDRWRCSKHRCGGALTVITVPLMDWPKSVSLLPCRAENKLPLNIQFDLRSIKMERKTRVGEMKREKREKLATNPSGVSSSGQRDSEGMRSKFMENYATPHLDVFICGEID